MKFVEEKSMEDIISYARWESRDEEARINATNLSMFISSYGWEKQIDILKGLEGQIDALYRPYITYDDIVDMFSDNNTAIPNIIGCEDWDEVFELVKSHQGRK